MEEFIITKFLDFLNQDRRNLERRYIGALEFNFFKTYLIFSCWLYMIIYAALLNTSLWILIPDYFSLICFKKLFISDSILGFLLMNFLLIFSSNYFFQELGIRRRFSIVLRDRIKKGISINWNKWDFRDIILRKPADFKGHLTFKLKKGEHFVLNLICQYPDGSFDFLGLTNNKMFKQDISKKSFLIKPYIAGNFKFDLDKQCKVMEKSQQRPQLIVGFRIRTSIKNNKVKIKELKIN